MPTAAGTAGHYDRGFYRVQLGNAGAAAGDMCAVLNPAGEDLIITKCIVNITTVSTGASTIDVGIAADAVTIDDTLIDGLSGASLGVFSTVGANGLLPRLWGATEYLIASEKTGDVAGFAGELLLKFGPRTSAGA